MPRAGARLGVVDDSGSPPGLALVATSTKSCGASRQARLPDSPPPRGTADDAAAHRAARRRAATGPARRDGASPRFRSRRARWAAPATASSARSCLAGRAEQRDRGDIGHHHRERLGLALLARRSARPRAHCARRRADESRRSPSARRCRPRASSADDLADRACDRRGPQRGQAIGSAWKRRFGGIAIVARAVRAHAESGAIDVCARS